jgi:hypothetical protein
VLVFAAWKKRPEGLSGPFRSPILLDASGPVHGIRELQVRRGKRCGERLWPWSQTTSWRPCTP